MSKPGTLLGHEQILQLLTGNQVFKPMTWSPDNVRAACYDLTMATDVIVVPDRPRHPSGRYYAVDEHRNENVILLPGDVAFVSTKERLCLPWNVSGHIAPKFALAAKGVLTLTGGFVDPGYGLEQHGNNWFPKNDQRLHFLLANMGPGPVVMKPGNERIASIQFSYVTAPNEKIDVPSGGFESLQEQFLSNKGPGDVGLIFFRNMADVKSELQEAKQEMRRFTGMLRRSKQRLAAVESGSNQIVMFGIYLICATFGGVALSVALATMQMPDFATNLQAAAAAIASSWWIVVVILLAALGAGWCGIVALQRVAELCRWLLHFLHEHRRIK
ncbi:MAG: hypothetical protein JWP89_375 [Schlesneria sp.]|nr:hypothetical protein [Schlesneria sp.]